MANVMCLSLGKKKNQQCQTGEAATSVERAKGLFTTPRKCSAMASSSTKAAFSAVSTAGKWTHSPFNGHNFQRGSWRGGSQDRTWSGGGDWCWHLSEWWAVFVFTLGCCPRRAGGRLVPAPQPLFQMSPRMIWGDQQSRKTQVCVSPHKGSVFLSWGVGGGKRVPSGLAFPFSNSSLQKCHANYRPNSWYADAKTRLWSTRCWMQQHETGQNRVSCRSACEEFRASQQLTLDVQIFNEQVAS